MKKNSMWVILGVILLVEVVLYFAIVSPQGGVIEEKTDKLEVILKSLKRYRKMGNKVPSQAAVRRHQENRQALQDEYDGCLDFLRQVVDLRGLKRWFPSLNVDWKRQPAPAQFQSLYLDEFKALRERCRDKGISISGKEDKYLFELETGEKVEGQLLRETDDEATLMTEGGERVLPRRTIKTRMKVTVKLTTEESQLVAEHQRLRAQPGPEDTVPDNATGGFWEATQLNAQNLRTAQKQFWIQKAFVDALVAAGGKQIVYVSFHREPAARAARAPRGQQPSPKNENAVEKQFERIPVKVLVKMPYGSIAAVFRSLSASEINMELRGLKVTKPQLAEIATNPHPDTVRGLTYTQQDGVNGVMPKVMDKNDGVNFGKQPMGKSLPGQDQLIDEPPVLIEFSYDVMDMKEQ